jgi:hypothetical protein
MLQDNQLVAVRQGVGVNAQGGGYGGALQAAARLHAAQHQTLLLGHSHPPPSQQ